MLGRAVPCFIISQSPRFPGCATYGESVDRKPCLLVACMQVRETMAVGSTYISEAEYLQTEREAEVKREYLRGQVFAMAGAPFAHVRIATNLIGTLYQDLHGTGCMVLSGDMRVKVSEASADFYPDVLVVRGQPFFEDDRADSLLNSVLIFEVLSSSTEEFDRREKFLAYQQLESLREYVLVSQERVWVEQWGRQADETWLRREYTQPEQELRLESVGGGRCPYRRSIRDGRCRRHLLQRRRANL